MKRFFTPVGKKVIFFDMNQTLVDTEESFKISFLEVMGDYLGRWSEEAAADPETLWKRYKEEWNKRTGSRGRSSPSNEKLRVISLLHALRGLPLPPTDSFARSFLRKVKEQQELSPRLFPGTIETMERLSPHYRLAIISNSDGEKQRRQLQLLKLDELIPIQHVFTPKDDIARKPHPSLYQLAIKTMSIQPSEGVMVGNSWKNDIAGAVHAGMDAVWIHPAHKKKSSQRKIGSRKVIVVRRLNQLPDIF